MITNLLIGKQITEDEQQGNVWAKYGKAVLKKLSLRLTEKYGRGFSIDNLENMRKCYLKFGEIGKWKIRSVDSDFRKWRSTL